MLIGNLLNVTSLVVLLKLDTVDWLKSADTPSCALALNVVPSLFVPKRLPNTVENKV